MDKVSFLLAVAITAVVILLPLGLARLFLIESEGKRELRPMHGHHFQK